MILYKYYGFKAGIAALESSKLGFRNPANFNDPFELSFLDNTEGDDTLKSIWEGCIENLRSSVLVLSLTRTPLNPLMWAHYGEDHTGFVIGYEVDTPFLNDENNCLVTVDHGDVVYTNTKPIQKLVLEDSINLNTMWLSIQSGGSIYSENNEHILKKLSKKLMLTKHASWVYEEEVRVIKPTKSIIEMFEEEKLNPMRKTSSAIIRDSDGKFLGRVEGLSIFDYKVDIREVYLGIRNPLLDDTKKENLKYNKSCLAEKGYTENWRVSNISMSKGTWGLDLNPLSPDIFS